MAYHQGMNCAILLILLFSAASQAEVTPAPETCAAQGPQGPGCNPKSQTADLGLSLLQKTAVPHKTKVHAHKDLEEEHDVSLLEEEETDEAFIARAMAAKWSFTEKLPVIIAGSVAAITEATPYFEKKLKDDPDKPDPAAMIMGITKMAKHLFKIFKLGFLELVEKETPKFDWDKFEKNWVGMWEKLPHDIAKVDSLLKDFSVEGKTHALVQAIGVMLEAAMKKVNRFLPSKLKPDFAKFGGIVTRTVKSVGASWAAFESGDGAKGAEEMYKGIKGNVDALLPASLKNDKTYKAIMGTVDSVMGKLSETVMKFKKKMTESRVCIKKAKSRGRPMKPKICPEGPRGGKMFISKGVCMSHSMASGALVAVKSALGYKQEEEHLDAEEHSEEVEEGENNNEGEEDVTAALQKRAAGGKSVDSDHASEVEDSLTGKDDEEKIYPECDEDSDYPDFHKKKCYKTCPNGYLSAGKVCLQECKDKFPVASGDWCGKSQTAMDNAKMQMVISAINAAASIAITIATAVENGKDKDAKGTLDLSGTIDALTNAALAFVFPQCKF